MVAMAVDEPGQPPGGHSLINSRLDTSMKNYASLFKDPSPKFAKPLPI